MLLLQIDHPTGRQFAKVVKIPQMTYAFGEIIAFSTK